MSGSGEAASTAGAPHLVKAVAWMGASILSFTVMAVSVRELPGAMSPYQMLFIRSALGLVVVCALLSLRSRRTQGTGASYNGPGGWAQIRTARLGGHVFRNVIHFAGQSLWIYGIKLLPLAMVFAIEFTTPIWGALLAVAFLGERMNPARWGALALGFVGVIVILRPDLGGISVGALVMLACTVLFATTNVVTKALTRSESALCILFYMTVMQTGFGGLVSLFDWTPVGRGDWLWLVLLGLTGLSAHFSLVRAFFHADASLVMPLDYVRLPLAGLVGYFLYQEAFALATLLGASLIVAGNYAALRHEARGTRKIPTR